MKEKRSSPLLLTPEADRSLKKLALLISTLPIAAEILVLYPLLEILSANIGKGLLYTTLSVFSTCLNLAGYFAAIALAIYCVYAGALSALGRVFALQSVFRLFGEVILRTFLLWLLALIDQTFRPSIALSDYMLSTLTKDNCSILFVSSLDDFFGVVLKIVLLAIIILIALLIYQKRAKGCPLECIVSPDGSVLPPVTLSLRIATLIYALQALCNQLNESYISLRSVEKQEILTNIGMIAAPYFLIAIFAFGGYIGMQALLSFISRKTLPLCSTAKIDASKSDAPKRGRR